MEGEREGKVFFETANAYLWVVLVDFGCWSTSVDCTDGCVHRY